MKNIKLESHQNSGFINQMPNFSEKEMDCGKSIDYRREKIVLGFEDTRFIIIPDLQVNKNVRLMNEEEEFSR